MEPFAGGGPGGDVERQRWLEAMEGTDVEPILRGLLEGGFQAEVARFVAERASAFAVCCADGSHPLVWTAYHREYRDLFEHRLDAVMRARGQSGDEVVAFVTFLQTHARTIEQAYIFDGLEAGDLHRLTEYLTSSEDYEAFLSVMFAEARRQLLAAQQQPFQDQAAAWPTADFGQPAPSPDPGAAATQQASIELEVTVPDGVGPGQVMAVDYLGLRYELVVPEGCGPGSSFRAFVATPGP